MVEQGEDEQIGTRYVTDNDGQIIVDGITPGNYYFLETNPAYGYTYDTENDEKKDKYEFSVSAESVDENDTVFVKAYNQKRYADLNITKTVETADNSALTTLQKNTLFDFTVTFSDNDTYEYSITGDSTKMDITSGGVIQLKHGQSAVIENIPVGVQYSVIETPTTGYTITSKNHQGNIPVEGITAEFVNTYEETTVIGNALIINNRVFGNAASTSKEFKFTITFGDNGEYPYSISNQVSTLRSGGLTLKSGDYIILKHDQEAIFLELPIGLTYTVTIEDYSSDGYTTSINYAEGEIVAEGTVLEFKNYKSTLDETGTLNISKKVIGTEADETKEFTFTVTFEDGAIPADTYSYRVNGESLLTTTDGKITLKHNETAVFEDIPVDVRYTVKEDDYSADGYIVNIRSVGGSIIGGEATSVNFINEYRASKLTVKKKVLGKVLDVDFTFHVTIDDKEPITFTLKHGEEKIIYVPNGSTYEVSEEDCFDDGYLQSDMTNGFGTATGNPILAEQTNTYIGTELTEIEVIKTWDMSAKPDAELPDSITIELKNGDSIVDVATILADENGEWKYTFVAPLKDEDGEEREYTVDEIDIPGYNETVTGTAESGFTITNKYVAPVKSNPIIVKKNITGDTPVVQSEFAFRMNAVDGAPMPEGAFGNTKVMTITGVGEVEFGDIEFETAGTYVYTLSETLGGASGYAYDTTVYTLTIVVEEVGDELSVVSSTYTKVEVVGTFDEVIFTNVYDEEKVTTQYTSLSVTKEWVGNDINQPLAVQVQLYQNGTAYGAPVTITATDNWKHTWIELSKDAVWTIDEINVPSAYTKTVTAESGFTIINTYQEVEPTPNEPGGSSNGSSGSSNGSSGTSNGSSVPITTDYTHVWTWFRLLLISMMILRYTLYWEIKTVVKARVG